MFEAGPRSERWAKKSDAKAAAAKKQAEAEKAKRQEAEEQLKSVEDPCDNLKNKSKTPVVTFVEWIFY